MQVRSVLDVSRHHSGAQSENRTRDLRITKVGRGFRDLAFLAIYQVFSDQLTSPSPANSVQFRPISWLRSWLASRPGRSVRAGGRDVILPTDRHRVTLPGGRGSAALVLCVCIKLSLRSMAGSHRPDGRFVAVIIEHCTWAAVQRGSIGGRRIIGRANCVGSAGPAAPGVGAVASRGSCVLSLSLRRVHRVGYGLIVGVSQVRTVKRRSFMRGSVKIGMSVVAQVTLVTSSAISARSRLLW